MKILLLLLAFAIPVVSDNGIKNVSMYPLGDMYKVRVDDHLQGIWKLKEDTDRNNYFIVEKQDDYTYSVTYMNKGGDNRGLEHARAFFSEIGGQKFLNVTNWNNHNVPGYIFLKIKEISAPRSSDITACLIVDTTLYRVPGNAELQSLVEKNLDSPAFYGQDLHFRKKFEFNSFK